LAIFGGRENIFLKKYFLGAAGSKNFSIFILEPFGFPLIAGKSGGRGTQQPRPPNM